MKPAQRDGEKLPKWAASGQTGCACFAWLRAHGDTVFHARGRELKAYGKDGFLFLYGREGNRSRLYGIFNTRTYELTDVSLALSKMLGFPQSFVFRSKKSEEHRVAEQVEIWLSYYLENQPELFYRLKGQLIPFIDRKFIESQAARFFASGAKPEEIRYIPEFHFGEDTQPFTPQLYLFCLKHGERAEQAIARQWIQRNGVEMYQQKVIFGCIRNEFDDIINNPRHKIRKECPKGAKEPMKERKRI